MAAKKPETTEGGEAPVKRGRGRPKGSTKSKGRGRPKGTKVVSNFFGPSYFETALDKYYRNKLLQIQLYFGKETIDTIGSVIKGRFSLIFE